MPKIKREEVIREVLGAYKDSQKEYENWTGGSWLWEAPEYLITVNIAKRLWELRKRTSRCYITLEYQVAKALEDSGARGRGKLERKIRENGKTDIILWHACGSPRALIEVKNQIYSTAAYKKDIDRIRGLLCKNPDKSSLEFGLISFYESANSGKRKTAEEKVKARIEARLEECRRVADESLKQKAHLSEMHSINNGKSVWQAVCIELSKRFSCG